VFGVTGCAQYRGSQGERAAPREALARSSQLRVPPTLERSPLSSQSATANAFERYKSNDWSPSKPRSYYISIAVKHLTWYSLKKTQITQFEGEQKSEINIFSYREIIKNAANEYFACLQCNPYMKGSVKSFYWIINKVKMWLIFHLIYQMFLSKWEKNTLIKCYCIVDKLF